MKHKQHQLPYFQTLWDKLIILNFTVNHVPDHQQWFSFLKHLDIPAKYPISHKIVEKLVESDLQFVEEHDNLQYDDIIDHGELTDQQLQLEEVIKDLSTKEAAFQIAQNEYEKKEERFLNLTNYGQQMLDQFYTRNELVLRDIEDDDVLHAIAERDYEALIKNVNIMVVVISRDVDIFRERVDLIMSLWEELSNDLIEKIKSFEFRGMKVISTNLRLKLKPILEEFKIGLKDTNLTEESVSRARIEVEINDMVERAREDIYGDLTGNQVVLLEEINPDLTKEELIRIMSDEQNRKDLVVLLETDKIDLKMKKVIDRLI